MSNAVCHTRAISVRESSELPYGPLPPAAATTASSGRALLGDVGGDCFCAQGRREIGGQGRDRARRRGERSALERVEAASDDEDGIAVGGETKGRGAPDAAPASADDHEAHQRVQPAAIRTSRICSGTGVGRGRSSPSS